MSRKLGTMLRRNKVGYVHDRDARTTKVFCRDRLRTVVKKKKKKKDPRDLGHHNSNIGFHILA